MLSLNYLFLFCELHFLSEHLVPPPVQGNASETRAQAAALGFTLHEERLCDGLRRFGSAAVCSDAGTSLYFSTSKNYFTIVHLDFRTSPLCFPCCSFHACFSTQPSREPTTMLLRVFIPLALRYKILTTVM